MKTFESPRGFREILFSEQPSNRESRLVMESSIVGDYPDSPGNPGSSYLWFGVEPSHMLDREEVADLIRRLQHWLDHKRLPME